MFLVRDELGEFIAARIALEEQRRDDWDEEFRRRDRFGQALLPLLAEFNAVDTLKDIERAIAGDHLDAELQQMSERSNRPAEEFVVHPRVTEERLGGIRQCPPSIGPPGRAPAGYRGARIRR